MFEIKKTDLAGRIGLIKTKNGVIETPVLLPVIHPLRQQVSTKLIKKIGSRDQLTIIIVSRTSTTEVIPGASIINYHSFRHIKHPASKIPLGNQTTSIRHQRIQMQFTVASDSVDQED